MTQAASSAAVVKDLLVAAAEGRLHEVQSLLDGGRCRVNDEDEVGTSRGTTLVYSRVECCLLCLCLYVSVRVGVFLDGMIFISPTYVYVLVIPHLQWYQLIYIPLTVASYVK